MTHATNITAGAASGSRTSHSPWQRTTSLARPVAYGLVFAFVNFLFITAVSYDYAIASVA